MTPEDRRAKQRDNQDFFSEKISELSRYIGFALAAVGMSFVSVDASFVSKLPADWQDEVLRATLLGCVTVLLDYLQYVLGWFASSNAAGNKTGDYKRTTLGKILLNFQKIAFYVKQITAALGSLLLILAISAAVF